MTRRRWIADEVSGNRATLLGSHADHLAHVLRARMGQEFDIAVGESLRRGRIVNIANGRVEFELGEAIPVPAMPSVTIMLSIFKFDRMEWAIEKCVELGAAGIVPVIAQRTESHLAAAAAKRVERWQRIARQASEQSRRVAPPEISSPVTLKAAIALATGTRIVLAESEKNLTLKDALENPAAGDNTLLKPTSPNPTAPDHSAPDHTAVDHPTLAFGPEGGWTESELELFLGAGWIAASLGNTILRAETAAIAATAIAFAELR
jgi:16S rRNA (uracil1498-N3)-methyltransferase